MEQIHHAGKHHAWLPHGARRAPLEAHAAISNLIVLTVGHGVGPGGGPSATSAHRPTACRWSRTAA